MTTEDIYSLITVKRNELGIIYALLLIQLRGGFRVSEVLKMKYSQIINDNELFIIADKGSNSKRVYVPEISKLLCDCRLNKFDPFKGISRFQVYRFYKSMGISLQNGVGKNKSVTHMPRKLYVRDSYNSSNSLEISKQLIGHKSIKSTKYYVKEK